MLRVRQPLEHVYKAGAKDWPVQVPQHPDAGVLGRLPARDVVQAHTAGAGRTDLLPQAEVHALARAGEGGARATGLQPYVHCGRGHGRAG